jgi:lipopolysaccharide/colanic/teichoic acid biosynthesis glycosyltransferase
MENNYLKIASLLEKNVSRATARPVKSTFGSFLARRAEILQEDIFHGMLALERHRAARSRKPFALMLLDASSFDETGTPDGFMSRVTQVLARCTRETDLVGWHEKDVVLGVIFTEINPELKGSIADVLYAKVVNALHAELGPNVSSYLDIAVHLFPEDPERQGANPAANTRFYPDLSKGGAKKNAQKVLKRLMDVTGSLLLLLLTSPLLAAIAIAIKLTSNGPVIFQQERLGRFGARFACLKFRTMTTNNDPKIHREFIRNFISGQSATGRKSSDPVVYKITNDSRITPVGRFLRKTSLDELPQFWNVLRGEMSLVGPRPSLPYEFEVYEIWHRRRVLEVKPGVTGLWQVSGRSRTCFDDMVRMDLRYFQSWSLWLDLRILLATPGAVFSGDGAY